MVYRYIYGCCVVFREEAAQFVVCLSCCRVRCIWHFFILFVGVVLLLFLTVMLSVFCVLCLYCVCFCFFVSVVVCREFQLFSCSLSYDFVFFILLFSFFLSFVGCVCQVNYAKYSAAPWLLPMGGLLSINSGCADNSNDTVQIVKLSTLKVTISRCA